MREEHNASSKTPLLVLLHAPPSYETLPSGNKATRRSTNETHLQDIIPRSISGLLYSIYDESGPSHNNLQELSTSPVRGRVEALTYLTSHVSIDRE
jgi:hypothetical protein